MNYANIHISGLFKFNTQEKWVSQQDGLFRLNFLWYKYDKVIGMNNFPSQIFKLIEHVHYCISIGQQGGKPGRWIHLKTVCTLDE